MSLRLKIGIVRWRSKLVRSTNFVVLFTLVSLLSVSHLLGFLSRPPARQLHCNINSIYHDQVSTANSSVNDKNGLKCSISTYQTTSNGRKVFGKPFVMDIDLMTDINLDLAVDEKRPTDSYNVSLSMDDPDFVVVTAADRYYLHVDMDSIGLVQKVFPKHRILYYDLSAETTEKSVIEKIDKLCNVEYVAFNFSRYPSHVRRLLNYAWKPLIIHDALRSYKAVLWIDSSMRMHSSQWNDFISLANSNGGIVGFDSTGHSIFAATHQRMFDYLPSEKSLTVNTMMVGANLILLYRNSQIYSRIIRWWVLCALTADCIAPTADIHCQFANGSERNSKFAECHRYDQSALNVLLANHFSSSRLTFLANGRSPKNALNTLEDSYAASAPVSVRRRERVNKYLFKCETDQNSSISPKDVVLVDDYFPRSIMMRIFGF